MKMTLLIEAISCMNIKRFYTFSLAYQEHKVKFLFIFFPLSIWSEEMQRFL